MRQTLLHSSVRRWLRLAVIVLAGAGATVGSAVGWAEWRYQSRLMTISEALWVADRGMTEFHEPGSAESAAVARTLIQEKPQLGGRHFEGFVLCWSRVQRKGDGFTAISDPMFFPGFDPAKIPAARQAAR